LRKRAGTSPASTPRCAPARPAGTSSTRRSATAPITHGTTSRCSAPQSATCATIWTSTCWRKDSVSRAGNELLFRLGGEHQRIALRLAGVGGPDRLRFGDVLGEHGDHAGSAPVRGDHDLVREILADMEFGLEHRYDEFA